MFLLDVQLKVNLSRLGCSYPELIKFSVEANSTGLNRSATCSPKSLPSELLSASFSPQNPLTNTRRKCLVETPSSQEKERGNAEIERLRS
jgi:hypothetical protein